MRQAKVLYLFRGPCGSGKTKLRKALQLDNVVGLDMADYDRELPIELRVEAPAKFLRENKAAQELWLEGVFAPGSPSLRLVLEEAANQRRRIQHFVAFADKGLIVDRLEHEYSRLRLSLAYHERFEEALNP